ncbi:unnamed protein product, partial [Rotaria magnacalcarata]
AKNILNKSVSFAAQSSNQDTALNAPVERKSRFEENNLSGLPPYDKTRKSSLDRRPMQPNHVGRSNQSGKNKIMVTVDINWNEYSNLDGEESTTKIHLNDICLSPPTLILRKIRACQVCYEEKLISMYREPLHQRCTHRECNICNDCVYNYVRQTLGTMLEEQVNCPELNCRAVLNFDSIKQILGNTRGKKLFERYDRFFTERALERMPDFVWCAHGCGSGQLAASGVQNNIISCIKCKMKTCFVHKTKWHEGLTCAQYDNQTAKTIRDSEKWLVQNTKKCPSCKSPIEKAAGCDHMTCRKCNYEFCWACLADFDRIRNHGNQYHHSRCKHYASPGE